MELGNCYYLKQRVTELETALIKAKEALDSIYDLNGTGLEVANWHRNGDLESLDSFIESSDVYEAIEIAEKALRGTDT
jgi:hypothetical protein